MNLLDGGSTRNKFIIVKSLYFWNDPVWFSEQIYVGLIVMKYCII